jgi:sortase (surface protein transpeptidase)
MASTPQPESARVGWLHPRRVLRWMALACAVAALSGVATCTPKQKTRLAKPPVASEASEVMSLAPPLERSLLMRRAVPDTPPPPSSTGHIRIPAIGVDASLIPLGLTRDRALDVPKDWGVAGWFEGGPFPGEPGPAVVVGHVDSTSGPAVFYRLRELNRGDVIAVWRKGGVRSRFRVVSRRWFSKSAFPTQLVYGSVDTPALRLITCGGAFDSSTGHYVDNLVVFASPMTDS